MKTKQIILIFFIVIPLFSISQEKQKCAKLTDKFLMHLVNDQPDSVYSMLGKDVKKLSPVSEIKKISKSFIVQIGKLDSTGVPYFRTIDDYQTVFLPVFFSKSNFTFKVSFNKNYGVTSYFFGPETITDESPIPVYADTNQFVERDLTIASGDFRLSGKLTLPSDRENCPVVILVHGSGPNGMNEKVGPNLVFRDIAWGLASKGIAVIRYDKRSYVYPTKMVKNRKLDFENEVLEDVTSAIELANSFPEINTEKIFVFGHSLGAYLAPEIGHRNVGLAGIIMAAAPSRNFEDVIWDQYNYIFGLDGISKIEEHKLKKLKKEIELVKSGNFNDSTPKYELPLMLPGSYWKAIKEYDHINSAQQLAIPMLILQGKKDYQVTFKEDFKGWKKALKGDGNRTFKVYKDLNHLFIESPAKKLSTPNEYDKEGNVDFEFVQDVANWVLSH